jgi:hypothetical protein
MTKEQGGFSVKNEKKILEEIFDPIIKAHLHRTKKYPDEARKLLQNIKVDREHYRLNTSRPYNAMLGVLKVSTEITNFAESYMQMRKSVNEVPAKGIILMEASFGIQATAAVLCSSEDLAKNLKHTYLEHVYIPEVLSGLTSVPTLRESTLMYLKRTEEERKKTFEQDKTGSGEKVIADFVSLVRKNFESPGFRAGAEFAQKYYKALYPLTA